MHHQAPEEGSEIWTLAWTLLEPQPQPSAQPQSMGVRGTSPPCPGVRGTPAQLPGLGCLHLIWLGGLVCQQLSSFLRALPPFQTSGGNTS